MNVSHKLSQQPVAWGGSHASAAAHLYALCNHAPMTLTLNLRRLVPTLSGVFVFFLVGCEHQTLNHRLNPSRPALVFLAKAALGEAAAATVPDPAALYDAAIALGSEAQYIAEGARSGNDWQRAAMGWERALNFLKAIPPHSPLYRAAQAKIYDYEGRFQTALGQARSRSQGGNSLPLKAGRSS